jgi:hypothetical protein
VTQSWHSLYLLTDDIPAVIASLDQVLVQARYTRFDPFTGGMGTPPGLKTFVKLFVAPAQDGWIRILGEPDPAVLPDLSRQFALLHAYLDDKGSHINVYHNGSMVSDGLTEFLRPGKTRDDLARAEQDTIPIISNQSGSVLPDEIKQLAADHNVNPQQANKLINRLTTQLFARLDRSSGGEASAMQNQAQALSSGAGRLDWNSPTARKLKGIMSLLVLPDTWRSPDFDDLRDAYQVARRLRKNPGAQLMPDEQTAIQAVPNAINYEAVYAGW